MAEHRLSRLVDPLGEALHRLRAQAIFSCRSELSAPWGLGMPPMPGCVWFHVVTAGRCSLHVTDLAPLELGAGDFALVPHGRGHCLRTGHDAATPDVTELRQEMLSERYSLLRHGGGGAATILVCGVVRLDDPLAYDLGSLLPAAIHLDAASALHADWMNSTLRLMAAEAAELRPGGETIITRLADILVIQAIRGWLASDAVTEGGWLAALRDGQLGRAIALVHREPARDWSVAALAAEAAMSRSGFAARFGELVGESPMHYVTRVRMRIAQRLLEDEQTSVAETAARLGYQSEAAFSRAFKRFVGTSPGAARRMGAAGA